MKNIAVINAHVSDPEEFERNRKLANILDYVGTEVERASEHHRPMASLHEAKSVIEEEFDEFWDLVKLNPKKPMVHPTKGSPLTPVEWRREVRTELVQTAAMCVRALYDLM